MHQFIQAALVSSRKIRGAEFGLLSHPGLLLQEDAVGSGPGVVSGSPGQQPLHQQRKEDQNIAGCEPRYQSAAVNVYASFSVADAPHGRRHLVERDVMFDVTELVRAELRVVDPGVASLGDGGAIVNNGGGDGNIVTVEGLNPGRTEIQVCDCLQ